MWSTRSFHSDIPLRSLPNVGGLGWNPIITWISSMNLAIIQQDTLALRCKDTLTWIFDDPVFVDWLDGSIRFLWCFGIRESSRLFDS